MQPAHRIGGARSLRLREDFHRILYAASGESARAAYTACARTWSKRGPGGARSLTEGGELLTFSRFPKAQWKTLRTTNAIERLNEEFRRRVKTQGSLPRSDAGATKHAIARRRYN
jgi:transposase-like protein